MLEDRLNICKHNKITSEVRRDAHSHFLSSTLTATGDAGIKERSANYRSIRANSEKFWSGLVVCVETRLSRCQLCKVDWESVAKRVQAEYGAGWVCWNRLVWER